MDSARRKKMWSLGNSVHSEVDSRWNDWTGMKEWMEAKKQARTHTEREERGGRKTGRKEKNNDNDSRSGTWR